MRRAWVSNETRTVQARRFTPNYLGLRNMGEVIILIKNARLCWCLLPTIPTIVQHVMMIHLHYDYALIGKVIYLGKPNLTYTIFRYYHYDKLLLGNPLKADNSDFIFK